MLRWSQSLKKAAKNHKKHYTSIKNPSWVGCNGKNTKIVVKTCRISQRICQKSTSMLANKITLIYLDRLFCLKTQWSSLVHENKGKWTIQWKDIIRGERICDLVPPNIHAAYICQHYYVGSPSYGRSKTKICSARNFKYHEKCIYLKIPL